MEKIKVISSNIEDYHNKCWYWGEAKNDENKYYINNKGIFYFHPKLGERSIIYSFKQDISSGRTCKIFLIDEDFEVLGRVKIKIVNILFSSYYESS